VNLEHIKSHSELQDNLKFSKDVFLLLYKSQAENSECALKNIAESDEKAGINILAADVNSVKDIHENYKINTVPTLLQFSKGKLITVLKGCHEPGFFKSIFEKTLYSAGNHKEEKKNKTVVVYTTPTCPHCTTVKNYLKGLRIPFRDINVAQDQKLAEAMIKKSGQQGVPQVEIDGNMIVGFNKKKIDELLEIR